MATTWRISKRLYCQGNNIDVISITFVNTFFSTGGLPSLKLTNGQIVMLSLGGAGGGVGLSNYSQAQTFADIIWNLFLGGNSTTGPFGSAIDDPILAGSTFDIEGGSGTGHAAFMNQPRAHARGVYYYISAVSQSVHPDASPGSVSNTVNFDAVYDWNIGLWDNWARTLSPNKKVYCS
ncbi:glycoside hydrolase superfamily [Multifurca ochricompacta]|uniref:Glycoside hydrolase superfamily n=1 Tax=Multifurca ochricompacta TaxID=376703 RepID=A0AAD4MD87_9AGAM|nr:glycoside hydrolase superfamily [Multifurca ochricompacta]